MRMLLFLKKIFIFRFCGCGIWGWGVTKLVNFCRRHKFMAPKHINLCAKTSQKLKALCRVSQCMSTNKKRLVMKAFLSSQVGYCPLIWMNHSRALNNKINRIHVRSLHVEHNDKKSLLRNIWTRAKLWLYMQEICKYLLLRCLR